MCYSIILHQLIATLKFHIRDTHTYSSLHPSYIYFFPRNFYIKIYRPFLNIPTQPSSTLFFFLKISYSRMTTRLQLFFFTTISSSHSFFFHLIFSFNPSRLSILFYIFIFIYFFSTYTTVYSANVSHSKNQKNPENVFTEFSIKRTFKNKSNDKI